MVCLSLLIFLQKKILLIIGLILIAGHNLLDSIVTEGQSMQNIIWYVLHQEQFLAFSPNKLIIIKYPVIPWIGIMVLGYLLGTFYQKGYAKTKRKKWLLRIGLGALAIFFVLRGLNIYGDLTPWRFQDTITKTVLSFFNVTKYPPSLLFACITLGPALLFLRTIESTKNRVTDFFLVFGRVPLFYYFIHVFFIHLLAFGGIVIYGANWEDMILTANGFLNANLIDYGYSLQIVYPVWLSVVLLLYPVSKKYMLYKANNKDKWWLSYL